MAFTRILAVFLCSLLLFSGCGTSGTGEVIHYDIPLPVENLDPQFATDEGARMIIANTFEGLLRHAADDTLEQALAREWQVSSDGLRYQFKLREDAVWLFEKQAAASVTADDFVFAFQRMFNHQATSPYASSFRSLKNADQILQGRMSPTALGVTALDTYTLEFTLEHPDAMLPELLASTAAMPCNRAFFESTRGRYGMANAYLQYNGPFYVRNWADKVGLISLRKNSVYPLREQVLPAGVDLYYPDGKEPFDPEARFLSGTTDAYKVSAETLASVASEGGQTDSFDDTVWVLALNLRDPALANLDLRRAAGYAIDRSLFSANLPNNLHAASTLVPPSLSVAGQSFREIAGAGSPVSYSQDLSLRSIQSYRASGGEDPPSLPEILVCEQEPQPLLAGYVQRNLQKHLSISTGLVRLPQDELLERVAAGNYALAILPLTPEDASPGALLARFRSDSAANFTGYANPAFDALLHAASSCAGQEQVDLYRQAEQQLLADCPVIPLYFETSYFATRKGVSGIRFAPFASGIDFRSALKK